jgi:L-fuconate dehydratase
VVYLRVLDIRFPTSQHLDGSDAMNPDPDYSAAYVILETDRPGLEGHGLTFTIGRGNEICCAAIEAMRHLVVGPRAGLDQGGHGPLLAPCHRRQPAALDRPGQGRDPPRHRRRRQRGVGPVGQGRGQAGVALVAEMSPEELVRCIDFRYITDCITPEEALALLTGRRGKAERIARSSGRLSLLHDLGRLARLFRREAAPALRRRRSTPASTTSS